MLKERVTQNERQKEIAIAIRTVYDLTPEFKVDGGRSVLPNKPILPAKLR